MSGSASTKTEKVAILWRLETEEERDEVKRLAHEQGMTIRQYVTWKVLGYVPAPETSRPGRKPSPQPERLPIAI
jgi:hypothetical protein